MDSQLRRPFAGHDNQMLETLRRYWLKYWVLLVALLATPVFSVVIAFALNRFGLLAVVIPAAFMGLAVILTLQNRLFLYVVAGLLAGYLLLSKGFAVIGFFPVFVSEIGMAAGIGSVLILFLVNRRLIQIKPLMRFEVAFLLIFLLSQIPATVPYFPIYQMDVLRDAMQYGYAVYTLCIGLLLPRAYVEKLLSWYHAIFPYVLTWAPIFFLVSRTVDIPIRWPGASISLISSKGSDLAVHLGGLGAYLMLRLDRYQRPWSQGMVWYLWGMFSVGFILLAIFGRAAMLTVLAAMFLAFVFRPAGGWYRPLILGSIGVSMLLLTGWYSTLEIDIGLSRKISAEQFVLNLTSIVGSGVNSTTHGHLEGTKQFRLQWWQQIIDYTFFGEYFLTGKGYGINLADSDGHQVGEDGDLRAPHNGHMTFLARSGVPGFTLWVIYLVASLAFLVRMFAKHRGTNPKLSQYAIWFLAYSVAFHVMTSFDVFMEGPMGGLWYWALQGIIFVFFTTEDKPDTEKLKSDALTSENSNLAV